MTIEKVLFYIFSACLLFACGISLVDTPIKFIAITMTICVAVEYIGKKS